MSSLSLINVPDQQSQIASLQRALYDKIERIQELEAELQQEKKEHAALRIGLAELRISLAPLYRSLQMVFGALDIMDVPAASSQPGTSPHRQVWDSWKQKLGGLTAKAIDVLLLHGPMNQAQLRIQLSCATRSVTNVVGALNKAGLIDKENGKIALKEL